MATEMDGRHADFYDGCLWMLHHTSDGESHWCWSKAGKTWLKNGRHVIEYFVFNGMSNRLPDDGVPFQE